MGKQEDERKRRQRLRSDQAAERRPVGAAGAAAESTWLNSGTGQLPQAPPAPILPTGDPPAGVLGEHWDDGGDPKRAQENNAVVRRSLRWLTNAKATDFQGADATTLPATDVAVLVTRRNMLLQDPKASNSAVSNLLRMEGQNQRDQLADDRADPFQGAAAAAGAVGAAVAGAVAGAAAAGLDDAGDAGRPLVAIYLPDNGRSLTPVNPIILEATRNGNGHAGNGSAH